VESHASAARTREASAVRGRRVLAGRVRLDAGLILSLALAGLLAAIAFVGNGGLQLGSATLVEVGVIVVAGLVVAAALLLAAEAPLYGGAALGALTALAGLTALSILWSLHPADSWIETNRTLAYVGAFAAGIAAVRLVPARWESVLYGVLLALAVVSLYGLATKVAPGWLAEDEVYARLREPYGYWNAVGITAAMAIPLCLWLGTRPGPVLPNALAHPLLGLLIVTMVLSFSRGSILAAVVGVGVWLALVPQRLKTLAVLLPAAVGAAAVTAWAFSQSALTDDRVPLGTREDAGTEFGLVLLGLTGLLLLAGVLIERRARERPLPQSTRRTLGKLALGSLAAVPLVVLAGLAFSERGIGGTISDRWDDLTSEEQAPSNAPGRLIETGNVRTIYWSRALDVWREHRLEGAGAGAFAQAQLRFRDQPTQGRHAHGYVHQTLADLGLLGLALSVAALAAWLIAAARTLHVRRAAPRAWTPERTGVLALALVAVVFGVHSAIDWTWFVPAVAVTGLFCAGWIAGRGAIALTSQAGAEAAPAASPLHMPRGRARYGRGALAAAAVALAVLAVLAVVQPWRADTEGDEALALLSDGNFNAARAAADRAQDINPLSIEPYFERAAIENAAGNQRAAARALEDAVRLEPASPEAWRRLGEYYVGNLDEPARAIPVLRAALFLDPTSSLNRGAYLLALRARDLERREARAAARAEAARRAARRKARRGETP
jgi:tetratricopeptide (TPR) repeat protein